MQSRLMSMISGGEFPIVCIVRKFVVWTKYLSFSVFLRILMCRVCDAPFYHLFYLRMCKNICFNLYIFALIDCFYIDECTHTDDDVPNLNVLTWLCNLNLFQRTKVSSELTSCKVTTTTTKLIIYFQAPCTYIIVVYT